MNDNTPIRHKDGDDVRSVAATRTAPFDLVSFRQRLLDKAGIDEDVLAESLRKAYVRLNEALDAVKVEAHTYRGDVVSESVNNDFRARLKAIELLLDAFGISVSSRSVPVAQPDMTTEITVIVNGWFSDDEKTEINVTPSRSGEDGTQS
jgi:hypothetical protein